MGQEYGKYALIQYCPVPERMEFLNIGVILSVPGLNYFEVRLVEDVSRIARFFGAKVNIPHGIFNQLLMSRLKFEFSKCGNEQGILEFSKRRANEIRLSQLLPVLAVEPEQVLEELFDDLVGDEPKKKRQPRMSSVLSAIFEKREVAELLDKPEQLALPEYGIKVKAPFGYQNGYYNLIDGMRLPENPDEGLKVAGKMAMEGDLIWQHYKNEEVKKRLVVVVDRANQSNAFFEAVKQQFVKSNVKLHDVDNIDPLIQDIRSNASIACSLG